MITEKVVLANVHQILNLRAFGFVLELVVRALGSVHFNSGYGKSFFRK